MQKINFTNFSTPSDYEKEFIIPKVVARRYRFYEYGVRFGVTTLFVVAFITIIFALAATQSLFLWCIPLIGFSSGISSIIGGCRSERECCALKKGECMLCKGIVTKIEKRNCWSSYITVVYENNAEHRFSVIGKQFKENDKVYIVIADQTKVKWAIPRIEKYI